MQQIHMPQLSRVNKVILIIMVTLFILDSILAKSAGVSLVSLFGLSMSGVKSGLIFQFVTYPLVSKGLLEVVFTGLLIWFLGSELEKHWGERNYITYLFLVSFLTGVFYLGISAALSSAGFVPIYGMNVFSSAMCVSYAILYPDRVFQFFMIIPVKAKYFCMILAFMNLYNGFFTPEGSMAWAQVCAMLIGGGFVYFVHTPMYRLTFGKLKWKSSKERQKSKLRIVEKEERPPKYWH